MRPAYDLSWMEITPALGRYLLGELALAMGV
jgi:hypothetical protein